MKITRQYLRTIIKEELQKISEIDSSTAAIDKVELERIKKAYTTDDKGAKDILSAMRKNQQLRQNKITDRNAIVNNLSQGLTKDEIDDITGNPNPADPNEKDFVDMFRTTSAPANIRKV